MDDVVIETVDTYLRSPNQLEWDRKRPLEYLLVRVCANKLIDHYRRARKQRSIDDPALASQLASKSNEQDLVDRQDFANARLRVLKQRIAQLQPDDAAKLMEIFHAVEIIGDDLLKQRVNKCIADFLKIPVPEVENRKKRMRRLMPELTEPGAD